MKYFYLASLLFLFFSCNKTSKTSFIKEDVKIIPKPKNMVLGDGAFSFNSNTKLVVNNDVQIIASEILSEKFKNAANLKLDIVNEAPSANYIVFKENDSLNKEAYKLKVSENNIVVESNGLNGAIYAIQSILQLLPNEIESTSFVQDINWIIPAVTIDDEPQYKWRGLMLDVARHFFEKEYIMKTIDRLAFLKMNTLHFHLVDDQGWRIEIKEYPKLTEVGAFRVDQEDLHWQTRKKNELGEETTYGGFYTQEDIKEIVAYAEKKGITVVPEIEMPAHVMSAIASYPELACFDQKIMVPSGGVWPITDIYCAGKESTFTFIENVLDEVITLFPSQYIHVGGDEATKTNWEKCPHCQKRMKEEGLKDVEELQSYFMKRIEKYVSGKGRKMIGWDEILQGGIAEGAAVMSWRGTKGGVKASSQGHDVVMTPVSHCYFDYYQGPPGEEPLAWGGYTPLSQVYEFSPVTEEMTSAQKQHILGGQANLFSEYIPTTDQSEYMIFPRLTALSEVLWTPKKDQSWEDFSERVQYLFNRLEVMNINYAESAYTIRSTASIDSLDKSINVELQDEFLNSDIRYITENGNLESDAIPYTKPIKVSNTSTIKAARFEDEKPIGRVFEKKFIFHKSVGKNIIYNINYHDSYQGAGDPTLVNVLRGSENFRDGQWLGWLGDNMDIVIDLGEKTTVDNVGVGTLEKQGSGIYFPKKISVFTSDDNENFKLIKTIDRPFKENKEGELKTFELELGGVNTRYLKVIAENLGKAPNGGGTWLFVDEIVVE
ncbi:family 20 glycosylhydrolase [Joostella sp.]|uniref:glycoside hydrolase family 20 protein n=1 Tax=Joostella sp. TaxID=2231138 RepID=UPI003A8DE4F8